MSFEIVVEGAEARFRCPDGRSVLDAMMAVGERLLPVGCRGGGCGVCRVKVLAGNFETGMMSAAHVPIATRAEGMALACQIFPRSNLLLRATGLRSPYEPDGDRRTSSGNPAGRGVESRPRGDTASRR